MAVSLRNKQVARFNMFILPSSPILGSSTSQAADKESANKDSTPTGDSSSTNQDPLQTEKLLKVCILE